jgi:hypothetical protein
MRGLIRTQLPDWKKEYQNTTQPLHPIQNHNRVMPAMHLHHSNLIIFILSQLELT